MLPRPRRACQSLCVPVQQACRGVALPRRLQGRSRHRKRLLCSTTAAHSPKVTVGGDIFATAPPLSPALLCQPCKKASFFAWLASLGVDTPALTNIRKIHSFPPPVSTPWGVLPAANISFWGCFPCCAFAFWLVGFGVGFRRAVVCSVLCSPSLSLRFGAFGLRFVVSVSSAFPALPAVLLVLALFGLRCVVRLLLSVGVAFLFPLCRRSVVPASFGLSVLPSFAVGRALSALCGRGFPPPPQSNKHLLLLALCLAGCTRPHRATKNIYQRRF